MSGQFVHVCEGCGKVYETIGGYQTCVESHQSMGVECGHCGGSIYFVTCPNPDHDYAIASECQGTCGEVYMIPGGCPDCSTAPKEGE